MENQQLFDDPERNLSRRNAGRGMLSQQSRQPYSDGPFLEGFEDSPAGIAEYLQILRFRKGTVILMGALGLAASLLFTLPETPIYQARGSIEIQNLNDNFLNMRNVSPTADGGGQYPDGSDVQIQTQTKILQSDSLLERVATKLDLGEKLFPKRIGLFSRLRNAIGLHAVPQAPTRESVLAAVAKNLKISTDANTRLVEIRYDSADPQVAADVVNTLTAEFIQQNLESHVTTTQQTGEWLTQQMKDIRGKLEQSEDDLQRYAQASGLVFTSDEKDNVAEEKLRELQEELSKAQADRVSKQSQFELVSTASAESLPAVLDDATLKEYQIKLTDLRRQLAELSSSLTPANPAVQKVQAQVTALEQAVEKERADITGRIKNEFESAQRREKLLAANYASQSRLMTEQGVQVAHYNILKREVDTNRQLYDTMLQNVQEAGMSSALGASNIRVVDPAHPPSNPYKPSITLNSVLGLLSGVFLGASFVILKERSDRSIQRPGETTLYLDVPELGAIPSAMPERNRRFANHQNGSAIEGMMLLGNGKQSQVELATSSKAPSILADSFRATLTSILFSGSNGHRPRIIVITSANPGEGKTTVASNLALALAELGPPVLEQPILLIDGDLRSPRLHKIFGVPNDWGLNDLLEGKKPPSGCEGIAFKTGFRNLRVLPAGSTPSNISGLLHSPQALDFLNRIRNEFHTVIIDTPPMLTMPDARVLGRFSDGVILVVRSAQTVREAAVAANQRLTDDGTRVLGTILNQWDTRKASQYAYSHGYKYPSYIKSNA